MAGYTPLAEVVARISQAAAAGMIAAEAGVRTSQTAAVDMLAAEIQVWNHRIGASGTAGGIAAGIPAGCC